MSRNRQTAWAVAGASALAVFVFAGNVAFVRLATGPNAGILGLRPTRSDLSGTYRTDGGLKVEVWCDGGGCKGAVGGYPAQPVRPATDAEISAIDGRIGNAGGGTDAVVATDRSFIVFHAPPSNVTRYRLSSGYGLFNAGDLYPLDPGR